jgi:phosphatidylinositol dimannoside acyltransferase
VSTPVAAGVREQLAVLGYGSGWSTVRRLPERAAYASFDRLADAAWRRRGDGVRRLEANLARALGVPAGSAEVREASRAGMRSYFRYWCDAFRLPDWDRERVVSRVRVEGEHRLRDNLASGRGVVAALPHMANWDHAGAWACLTGVPVTTVAERLRPERLYDRFLAYRTGLGMEVLPLTGGREEVFGALVRRLREPRLVPLLADRDLTSRGVEVELLGEPARLPPGPAALALRTGAALLPVTLAYEGDAPDHRLVIRFHEEVPPPAGGTGRPRHTAMTQRVADVFSSGIRSTPQDWHMLQTVFSADVDQRRPPDVGTHR